MPYKNPEDRKAYYNKNKERIQEYQKEWKERNKEKQQEKITCPCGGCFLKRNKKQHEKGIEHLYQMDREKYNELMDEHWKEEMEKDRREGRL